MLMENVVANLHSQMLENIVLEWVHRLEIVDCDSCDTMEESPVCRVGESHDTFVLASVGRRLYCSNQSAPSC